MVIDDLITTGHARALLGITDSEKQYITAQQIFDENLSVRETEKLIKKLQNDKVNDSYFLRIFLVFPKFTSNKVKITAINNAKTANTIKKSSTVK